MRVNKKGLADFLGVSTNTIGKWMDHACPHERDGRNVFFESVAVMDWLYNERPTLETHKRNHSTIADIEADAQHYDAEHERARKDAELADKTALENKVRRGELVAADEIEAAWLDIAAAIKSKFLGIGAKLAPVLAGVSKPNTIKKHIDKEARQILTELSKNE